MKTIDAFNLKLQAILDVFLGIASVLMLAVNLAQVGGRYIFHSSIPWSEEFSTYLYIWIIFLALYTACRQRNELNIDILLFKNPVARRIVLTIREVFSLVALIAFFYGSVLMIKNALSFPQMTASLGISTAPLYFCIPLSFAMLIWMKLVHLAHDVLFYLGKEKMEAN